MRPPNSSRQQYTATRTSVNSLTQRNGMLSDEPIADRIRQRSKANRERNLTFNQISNGPEARVNSQQDSNREPPLVAVVDRHNSRQSKLSARKSNQYSNDDGEASKLSKADNLHSMSHSLAFQGMNEQKSGLRPRTFDPMTMKSARRNIKMSKH